MAKAFSLLVLVLGLAFMGCEVDEHAGGTDAAVDAGPDASADAGPDASADAGPDASADAGPDASADASADSGEGGSGDFCQPAAQCDELDDETCLEPCAIVCGSPGNIAVNACLEGGMQCYCMCISGACST